MNILGKTEKKELRLTHGGREVLRICIHTPAGECPAAAHIRTLAERFSAHARAELYPRAAASLAEAVAAGRGYTFVPQRCEFSARSACGERGITVHLRATHTAGCTVLLEREIPLLFDAKGQFQLSPRHTRAERRPRKLKKEQKNDVI